MNEKMTVIRDTREKEGAGWMFKTSPACTGTVIEMLKTGDYTLKGLENKLVIERKGAVSEFAQNVFQDRFERELERLDSFRWPFIVLEFTLEELLAFPNISGVPWSKRKFIRAKGPLLLKRLNEFQVGHKANWVFAGNQGATYALSLFKRVWEHENRPTAN